MLPQTAASKAAPGNCGCDYGMTDKQITFLESYDSENAMDIHVGMCFEHYSKMLPHCKMTELVGTCDKDEVEFWTSQITAWGAEKAICTAAF